MALHFKRTKLDDHDVNPKEFREYAGVLTAFIVVMAFTSVGFVLMAAKMFNGVDLEPPADWMAAMLSLASAGLGYLIGKQQANVTSKRDPD